MNKKLGRKPPLFTPKMLKSARYMKDMLVALPAPPAVSADFVSAVMKQVPKSDYPFGMDGNDEVGCCTCSWQAHGRMERSANTGTIVDPTTAEVLALYGNFGYRPGDPATDNGAAISDVCAFMHTTGAFGVKSIGYAPIITDQVGPTQIIRIKQGIEIFGAVNLGVNLPNSADTQFDAGKPWTVSGDLTIAGGHCVGAVKYDNNYLYVVTWGRLQAVAWAWVLQFVEEGWIELYPDFITKKGVTPDGFDLAHVESYLKAMAA